MKATISPSSAGVTWPPRACSGTTPSIRAARRKGRLFGQFPPTQIGRRSCTGAGRNVGPATVWCSPAKCTGAPEQAQQLQALVELAAPPHRVPVFAEGLELGIDRRAETGAENGPTLRERVERGHLA